MADYDTDKWEPVGGDDSAATSPYTRNASFAKSGPYITKLTPGEQAKFQSWVKANKVPYDPSATADYDMPGYWKDVVARGGSKTAVNPVDKRLHYPDTYKTPYHESFSNESRYATKNNPFKWKGETLIDSRTGKSVYETQAPKKEAPVGLDTSKWSVVPPGTDASLASKPAEMSAGGPLGTAPGPITEAVEEAIRTGAFMGGEAAGEAGGLASAPVTGAAGPLAGPSIGAGIGGTLGDAATALYNHMMFHTPIDVSAKNLLADAGINVGGAVGGGLAARGIGKAAGVVKDFVQGKAGYAGLAKQAAESATELEAKAVKTQATKNLVEQHDTLESASNKAVAAGTSQAKKNEALLAATAVKAQRAKEDFITKQVDIERKAIEQTEALKARAAVDVAKQARAAKFTSAIGRGPEGANMARNESGAAQAYRKQALYETISKPLNEYSAQWGQQRDALLKGDMETPIATGPIGEAVERQNNFLTQRPGQTFSRKVQNLLDHASGLSPATEGAAAGLPPKVDVGGSTIKLEDIMSGKNPMTLDMYRQIAKGQGLLKEGSGTQVKALLSLRSLASALSGSESGINKTAARDVMNSVDKAIAEDPDLSQKLPKLKRLNAEWRNHKELFPDSLRDDITAGTPAQFGPQMFNVPVRAQAWLKLAKTPHQKLAMRDLYADYVQDGLRRGQDIGDLVKPEHSDFLKAVVSSKSPLATDEGIRKLTTRAMSWEETVQSSPAVRQQYYESAVPAIRGAMLDKFQATTRNAIKEARKMGPLGEQFIENVQKPGISRVEQYKMATRFMTGHSPEEIVAAAQKEQIDPRAAALTANAGQTPQQVQGSLKQTPPEYAGRAAIQNMGFPETTQGGAKIPTPSTPREAALAALRSASAREKGAATQRGSGAQYYVQRADDLWPIYAAVGLPAAEHGHVNFSVMMLLLGSANKALSPFRRAFGRSLEDPRFAETFLDAIMNPAAKNSTRNIGQAVGRAMVDDIASEGLKAYTGTSLEQDPNQQQGQ